MHNRKNSIISLPEIFLCLFVVLILWMYIPTETSAVSDGAAFASTTEYCDTDETSVYVQEYHDANGNAKIATIDPEKIEPYFIENGLDYYAYMDLHSASPDLIPVILEARYRIIQKHSWVDDGLEGWIKDEFGNVIEVLPHFHDIFPEDWENPRFPEGTPN